MRRGCHIIMETWKIGVILALVLGLGGYGLLQQKQENAPPLPVTGQTATPVTNAVSHLVGQSIGGPKIPAWQTQISPWANTKTPVTVASLKGKPALVEFFRINCSHCQQAAPFLEALYKRYQPRGLQMAAIQSPGNYKDATNDETKWPKVQGWAKARALTYPIGFDAGSKYFQGTLKGDTYPTMMVTDANGKVVYAETGHDDKKAVDLAIELEKQFPGTGDFAARGRDLARFLAPFVGGGISDPALLKAFSDDLAQRLEGKVKAD